MMLETVHRQHEKLRETYKAQLSIEKADRLELERMLKEQTAAREAAEKEAEAARREKQALETQTREREMKEKYAELEAMRARLEADKMALSQEREKLFKENKDSSNSAEVSTRRPSTPRTKGERGSSGRSRSAVNFKDSPEILECREASPTRSRFGTAVNTAFAVGGAALTAAVAVPLVTGLLAVDAIKFVRGDKKDADDPESATEEKAEKAPAPGTGHRRRWSVANDGREVSFLAPKMVDVD